MIDLACALSRTQEVAREVVAVHADRCDREASWPQEGIRAMQAAGLAGLVVPRDCGGLGFGLGALTEVCEILGEQCASTAICFGMHCVGSAMIAANVTPAQQEQFIAPIVAGRHITTLSLSESGTGSHFYLPQTRLDVDGDGFVINGSKAFVTNGGYADSYVVSAATAQAEPGCEFSCVVLPMDSEGLRWGAPWSGLGLRGNSSRTLDLVDVDCPRQYVLGREGDQIWYIFNVVCPYFLTALAGTYVGVARSALAEARQHLMERHHTHNGLTLAQSSVMQHRLGVLWARLERTRCLVHTAAARFDAGEPDALITAMAAKVEVADCVMHTVDEAQAMCGGTSYRDGSRLHRLSRDARAAPLMSPTTDILQVWIGRALLGQPLLAD